MQELIEVCLSLLCDHYNVKLGPKLSVLEGVIELQSCCNSVIQDACFFLE